MTLSSTNRLFFFSDLEAFYFYCLIFQARTSNTVWIAVVKAGILFSSWCKGKNFHSFTIECDVRCGFFINAFYHVGKVPAFYHFSDCYHERMLDFVRKIFSASVEIIICFLPWMLLMCKLYWLTFIAKLLLHF